MKEKKKFAFWGFLPSQGAVSIITIKSFHCWKNSRDIPKFTATVSSEKYSRTLGKKFVFFFENSNACRILARIRTPSWLDVELLVTDTMLIYIYIIYYTKWIIIDDSLPTSDEKYRNSIMPIIGQEEPIKIQNWFRILVFLFPFWKSHTSSLYIDIELEVRSFSRSTERTILYISIQS